MHTRIVALLCLTASLLVIGCRSLQTIQDDTRRGFAHAVELRQPPFVLPQGSRVDSIVADHTLKTLTVYLNKDFSYEAYRPENIRAITSAARAYFANAYPEYTVALRSLGEPVEELVPNFFRPDPTTYDHRRMPVAELPRPAPVALNVSKDLRPSAGLFNRNIVLWHSHGWYFNNRDNRWEWQRPRLFQSVEDRVPMSFTIPYLIPMLENAGAHVFVPRERDVQTHEVVVDNDAPGHNYIESSSGKKLAWGTLQGFALGMPPYGDKVNPFALGTSRSFSADTVATATVTWIPEIPVSGDYGVSIAFASGEGNVPDAHYTVFHAGGKTDFVVNQQIGGGTWLYLGTFTFNAGYHPDMGRVVLNNKSDHAGMTVSADAARFGGGMGIIMRNGHASGRPKFIEGARYFLQYAGMPDTLVYNLNRNDNDYKDDYQSRAEYGNYLYGAPFGPNRNRQVPGLGIPMDLSMAFHTDAGITHNDTTVGTLSIYSVNGYDTLTIFPDSMSRLANRDLADIVQTQITGDLRQRWDAAWNRRQLRDADYSEAVRPNVPALLLELLSHQNFLDMQFMLDPRFRFDVARAIYKGMLRFLATQHGTPAVIQPLPPVHLASAFSGPRMVTLRWRPQTDPLEPTAVPAEYIVSTRIGTGGFDNGVRTTDTSIVLGNIPAGQVVSYRVTALNSGGESFPSEILSVGWLENGKQPVLVVNAFDRICGPEAIKGGKFEGFLPMLDAGVPDKRDFSYIGAQVNFDQSSPFVTNDAPGHGMSSAGYETRLGAGNSFDYPAVHGAALMQCGYSFVSCSDEALEDSLPGLAQYRFLDLILGKEKSTHWQRKAMDSLRGVPFEAFPRILRNVLTGYCASGGALFVNGAYVLSDLAASARKDSSAGVFAKNVLHASWVTDHASQLGTVVCVDTTVMPYGSLLAFNTIFDEDYYTVESADEVGPTQGSTTLLRYGENAFSAAVGYRAAHGGVVVAGFPFETVKEAAARALLMRGVLRYFHLE